MTLNIARLLFQTCTVRLSSLCHICRVNLQSLCLDRAWSMIQTLRLSDWQTRYLTPYLEPDHTGKSHFDISSSSYCWWARSYAANSLAWLAWKADSLLGGEWGVPAHAHLAHEQGVELTHILCCGFSEKKGQFWQKAPLTKSSPRVQKGADKALLALRIWPQYKSRRGTHKASNTKSPLETR